MNLTTTKVSPWLLLFGRTGLFLGVQALFALRFYVGGTAPAWDASANWWPLSVTLVNGVCLAAMSYLLPREGELYWTFFRIKRPYIKADLLALVVILVIAVPVSYLPNVLLATALFGDAQGALDLLMRPLPFWAAMLSVVLFPVTQGLVELPLYFLYVMPRLYRQGVSHAGALTLAAIMLSLQHVAIPFLFDQRFITWRALMFLPFAFLVGVVLQWRPRLLPYLAIVHVLMDLAAAAMLLSVVS